MGEPWAVALGVAAVNDHEERRAARIASAQASRAWVLAHLLPVLRRHGTWVLLVDACREAGCDPAGIGDRLEHATAYVDVAQLSRRRTYLRAFDCRVETQAELERRLYLEER